VTSAQPSLFDEAEPTVALDADAAARRAIVERLDATLFVEAGAGSGKTKSLVDRVVALVTVANVPMREIVAVTFTEKAAAELRDRIRRELERKAAEGSAEIAARAAVALDDLDGAAVSTLHAFAQRLLVEHPIEAGLPPRVEVLDDIASQVAFEERWNRFLDRLLDDPAVERPLLLALNTGVDRAKLRSIALACNANWDLVATRMGPEPEPPALDVDPLLAAVDALSARGDECTADDDKLLDGLRRLATWADALRHAPDEYEQLRILHEGMPRIAKIGLKGNWRCDVDEIRATTVALREAAAQLARDVTLAAVQVLAWEIARFTLEEAEARRRAGELEFHDLLVLGRAVLRDPVHGIDVRRRLRARYTRLLLDEFQDTDPIQWDLAALLASGDPDAASKRWDEVVPDAGRLFVVGDPKQSIYRFRRADIAAFLRARDTFAHGADDAAGADRAARADGAHGVAAGDRSVEHLTRNFRSDARVIDFVNHVFGDLIVAEPESQPEYVPLEAARGETGAPAAGAANIVLLGATAHATSDPATGEKWKVNAQELRQAEAADVAGVVCRALAEAWPVTRRGTDGSLVQEPCRPGDIAVLLPARTSLGQLEDALDTAGIPYRTETSSLVYSTPEIRNLLLVLRAVDDPTDELALVSALRSPLFGCGDDDLYTYAVEHGGRWNHQTALPDSLPDGHPVGDAMLALADWYGARLWLDPSELLDRIVRERRVLELGFASGRPRDLWRRVRFVVDQARAFAESGAAGRAGTGLRDFLAWADLQSSEGARVVETVLPETDDDAVRILTVHGAKGLEFPIAVVSGATTQAAPRSSGVQLLFPHDSETYALRISSSIVTEEFERYTPIDEQMDFHEKLRLLYVALTRARDHLVVSVHRADRTLPDRSRWTHAELLWHAAEAAPGWEAFDETAPVAPPAADGNRPATLSPIPDWLAWRTERDRLVSAGSAPRVRSATAIARAAAEAAGSDPGLRKGARDLELPPWNKGRYGTAVGRAVHAVLQSVDLATGADLDAIAAAQAASEGVIGHESEIAALARAALDSDTVRTSVVQGYRREMYVAAPIGDTILEGYVDLVAVSEEPAGLVVVDYKTDAWRDDTDLDAKLERYRLQGASYAVALESATATPVVACVFLFLTPGRAVARAIDDLPAAMHEVRALLGASAAVG
jgi:ATP-dependent helicase/nuclease subunit A